MVATYLPETLFIPTFGNNDFKFHYQAPTLNYSKDFYSTIFDLWFTKNPMNQATLNLTLINETFLDGGYYRVDLPESPISILAMNTIAFNSKEVLLG
jgi:hypothetical protein